VADGLQIETYLASLGRGRYRVEYNSKGKTKHHLLVTESHI
jgi:hypothetical protein